MTQMTNEETDTALILENELKRRVKEVLGSVVHRVVQEQMKQAFANQKAEMMMEVSIAVGKMLQVVEEEGRNPLWETDMDKLGFGQVPVHHNIEKVDKDALHQHASSL